LNDYKSSWICHKIKQWVKLYWGNRKTVEYAQSTISFCCNNENAKELILGKIRSNQLTKPIMTAMMLLSYDTKATIDFLYDENISEVLRSLKLSRWFGKCIYRWEFS
jgi:hypothetical protein